MSITTSTFVLKTTGEGIIYASNVPPVSYNVKPTSDIVLPFVVSATQNKNFKITVGADTKTCSIADGAYTDLETLRGAISTAIAAQFPNIFNAVIHTEPGLTNRIFILSTGAFTLAAGDTYNALTGLGLPAGAATTSYVVTIYNNSLGLALPQDLDSTYQNKTYPIAPGFYANPQSLMAAVQTSLNAVVPGFKVTGAPWNANLMTISRTQDPYILSMLTNNGPNILTNPNLLLGFATTILNPSNSIAQRQWTFNVDFYPPSTITDTNVFMRLVHVEVAGWQLSTTPAPFGLYITNLPQPVGTVSTTNENCDRSTLLGLYRSSAVSVPGPRILTHIPDGLQTLTFVARQLDSNTNSYRIQSNTIITAVVEFEVSTSK